MDGEETDNLSEVTANSQTQAVTSAMPYRWWLASDTSAAVGTSMRAFVVPLLALFVTGSAAFAGLIGTIQAVCTQAVLLAGGIVIDRHDRARLIRLNGWVNCILLVALAVTTGTEHLHAGVFIVASILFGLAGGLLGEASDAALRSVVPQERYPQAVALNEGRDAAIRLAIGPVGGFLMGWVAGSRWP